MAPRGAPRLAAATLVVAVLVIASQASAHPTFYPEVARRLATGNMSCVDPGPAPVLSYHIHMLYSQNNAKDTSDALAAKAAFAAHFGLDKVPPCHGLFHQGRACMEIGDTVPAGPFPIAQWSAFILPQNFSTMVPWIMQNRGRFDILVHPNSGCEVEDHTIWPMWGGNPWWIDVTAFSHDCPGCTPQSDDGA